MMPVGPATRIYLAAGATEIELDTPTIAPLVPKGIKRW
jgi:hypothetical protein